MAEEDARVTAMIQIRSATVEDVPQIAELVALYARQGLMLPRSAQSLCEHVQSCLVGAVGDRVLGVGALHVLAADLAEIRSLCVAQDAQGSGLGGRLVDALCARAKELRIPRVLALTYRATFFSRSGFEIVDRESLRAKIWKDCISCPKQHACDEIALVRVVYGAAFSQTSRQDLPASVV